MGQEASVPTQADGDHLEEQATAPPSSTYPPGMGPPPPGPPTLATAPTGRSGRGGKLITAMFRGGQHHAPQPAGHGPGTTVDHDFEQREAIRAAAAGGNIYLEDSLLSDENNNSRTEMLTYNNGGLGSTHSLDNHHHHPSHAHFHHQQQQGYAQGPPPPTAPYGHGGLSAHHHLGGSASSGMDASSAPLSFDGPAEPPVVGVMFEKSPPAKKGVFPGRSGRGAALINSMRNLSLGGALRASGKQHKGEVQEWEKQWDEDEDDSEEGEADMVSLQQQQKQQQIPPMHVGEPGHIASTPLHHKQQNHHHLPVTIPPDHLDVQQPPFSSPSATIPPNYLTATPPSAAALNHHGGLVYPTSPKQQAPNLVTPEMTITPPLTGAVVPDDLLSKPAAVVSDDDGLEWDTGLQGVTPGSALKPDVHMFPMLRVLGKGSFGKVVLVQKSFGKERGQLFAMKILKKTHLVKRRQIERTRTERKVLSVVNHPFIMKLHYAFQTEDRLYLVLDYCPGGELFFHLSRFRRFPERVARFYSAELLLAIGHLHKRGIIYRDLKPENVLLDADGHVKLGDFGLAKSGIQHPLEGAHSMCGTPEYMAPEVLAQQGHGFCVDYWGLGMILYEMMTGLPPWYTTDRAKLFRRLKSAPLDIPSFFSVPSANCVSALLERNPRRRLGVTGIRAAMEHDFFRNISWRGLYGRKVEPPIRPCEGWRAPEGIMDEPVDLAFGDNTGPNSSANHVETMGSGDLEAATANFDNTFTRMPVQSEDAGQDVPLDDSEAEELNENTFIGFSFDIKDRDEANALAANGPSSKSPYYQNTQPALE